MDEVKDKFVISKSRSATSSYVYTDSLLQVRSLLESTPLRVNIQSLDMPVKNNMKLNRVLRNEIVLPDPRLVMVYLMPACLPAYSGRTAASVLSHSG